MKAFRANGSLRAGKNDQQFSVDIVAPNRDKAMETVFSNFGSKHRVTRRFVNIDSIEEIDPSSSNSPSVVAHFGITQTFSSGSENSEEE